MANIDRMCSSKWNVVFAYSVSLVGVLIFAKGFFPMKTLPQKSEATSFIPPSPTNDTILTSLLKYDFLAAKELKDVEEKVQNIPTPFKKLVFVLIDAMKYDFVYKTYHRQSMPYLSKLFNDGRVQLYKSLAKAPTVTLPRLKALLTGSVPGYLDVILNLDQSAELKEDSFISSLRRAQKKIIFYGDTTWIRLFPNAFIRKEGTSGLFVTDYTEVDFNVTRHLDEELHSKKDWDVMILHYLGLDHVGHLVGPASDLMAIKLTEMDSVISTIFDSLKHEKDALIVVTSDHGMTAQGSHGGTTIPEVETPLLLLYPDFQIKLGAVNETVMQSDVAATLSILMGVSIPSSSMGRIIPSCLEVLGRAEELHALQYNCYHLLNHAAHSGAYHEFEKKSHPLEIYRNGLQFHSAFLSGDDTESDTLFLHAKQSYMKCQELISTKLTSKLASYDYPVMGVGVALLALGLCLVLFVWLRILLISRHDGYAHTDSSRRMTRALFFLFLGCLLHLATLPGSSFVEEEHQIWHFLTSSTCLLLFVAFLRTIALVETNPTSKLPTPSLYDAQFDQSSSMLRLRRDPLKGEAWTLDGAGDVNPMTVNGAPSLQSEAATNKLPIIKKEYTYYVVVAFTAVVIHRIVRAWNQTGIKYADQADIEDVLNASGNIVLRSLVALLGLLLAPFCVKLLCTSRDTIRIALTVLACGGIYCFRSAICAVAIPWLSSNCGMGLLESRFVFLCVCLLLLKFMFHRLMSYCSMEKRSRSHSCSAPGICSGFDASASLCSSIDCFLTALILISALLLRPHNHLILVFNLFLYLVVFRLLWPVVVENRREVMDAGGIVDLLSNPPVGYLTSTELVARVTAAYWFGQMAYFTLGNSNSFATVDLSAAYIGLSGGQGIFNYLAAGALGAFATYVGPILWTCMCVADIVRSGSIAYNDSVGRTSLSTATVVASTLACLRLVALAVYVAVATGHRYHLFVWSVFSPKLMYELVSTAVFWCLLHVVMLFC